MAIAGQTFLWWSCWPGHSFPVGNIHPKFIWHFLQLLSFLRMSLCPWGVYPWGEATKALKLPLPPQSSLLSNFLMREEFYLPLVKYKWLLWKLMFLSQMAAFRGRVVFFHLVKILSCVAHFHIHVSFLYICQDGEWAGWVIVKPRNELLPHHWSLWAALQSCN